MALDIFESSIYTYGMFARLVTMLAMFAIVVMTTIANMASMVTSRANIP